MNLLAHILGFIYVIEVDYSEEHTYKTTIWKCHIRRKDPSFTTSLKTASQGIVIVTVYGHGVISKPLTAPIVEKIRANPDTFIWSETDNICSFVRKEQLSVLFEYLAAAKIYPQLVLCQTSPEKASHKLFEKLYWKDLFRLQNHNSAFAQAIAKRIMIPVLSLFLIILSLNAFLAPQLQTQYQELQQRLAAQNQTNIEAASVSHERRRILQSFSRHIPGGYVRLCNLIGICVPDKVTLTELWLEPLIKRFDGEGPLSCNERCITISGYSDTSSEIGHFTEALNRRSEFSQVKLRSIEKDRNARLLFKIEIQI